MAHNPARIGVAGYSAGGHLALFAAGTQNQPQYEGSGGNAGVGTQLAACMAYYAVTGPAWEGFRKQFPMAEGSSEEAWKQAEPGTHVKGFPPTVRELLELKPDCEALIRYLSRTGKLVEMEDGVLFEAGRYQAVRERIIGLIRKNGSISIQTAREEFGYTRKYVIPLFNKLDSEGVTLLKDNERVFTTAFARQQKGEK